MFHLFFTPSLATTANSGPDQILELHLFLPQGWQALGPLAAA